MVIRRCLVGKTMVIGYADVAQCVGGAYRSLVHALTQLMTHREMGKPMVISHRTPYYNQR